MKWEPLIRSISSEMMILFVQWFGFINELNVVLHSLNDIPDETSESQESPF
jgi:hypothetical protein